MIAKVDVDPKCYMVVPLNSTVSCQFGFSAVNTTMFFAHRKVCVSLAGIFLILQ